jgi:hypothetical protein
MKSKTKLSLKRHPLFGFGQDQDPIDTLPTTVTITTTTTGFSKGRTAERREPLKLKREP